MAVKKMVEPGHYRYYQADQIVDVQRMGPSLWEIRSNYGPGYTETREDLTQATEVAQDFLEHAVAPES